MAGPAVVLQTDAAVAALRALGAKAPKAIARGINRTIATGKTSASRLVASDLRIRVSKAKDAIDTRLARPERLTAQLTASAKRLPLIEFGGRGPYPSRGRGRGVSVKLPGGQARFPHAFIAVMRSGHRGIYERRKGAGRLPIVEKRGPSIAHVVAKHIPAVVAELGPKMGENIAHEIAFAAASKSRT
jgi:hypothetical protein